MQERNYSYMYISLKIKINFSTRNLFAFPRMVTCIVNLAITRFLAQLRNGELMTDMSVM